MTGRQGELNGHTSLEGAPGDGWRSETGEVDGSEDSCLNREEVVAVGIGGSTWEAMRLDKVKGCSEQNELCRWGRSEIG